MRKNHLVVATLLSATVAALTAYGGGEVETTPNSSATGTGSSPVPAPAQAPAPTPAPPPVTSTVFPLRVEVTKRYLVDAASQPFLLNGDTAWSLLVQLTREEAELYLEDRRVRGFNAVLVNLIEHQYSNNAPLNRYGQGPFTTPGNYSTPNPLYFDHVDWVLRKAAEKGIVVMLVPSYTGCCGDGWYSEMAANGATAMLNFGRYLGQRYQSFANILWVHGGDSNPANPSLVSQIAAGIREYDRTSLNSAHTHWEQQAMAFWGSTSWMQVNNIYTYEPVYQLANQAYARADRMPFFLIESNYENEREAAVSRIRTHAYHAVLSGATGHLFGNNPIWHFNAPNAPYQTSTTWQQALNSAGSRAMTHLRNLFAAHSWWALEPDSSNTTLTGGLGSGQDRAVAARAGDSSYAITYMPNIRTITVNLGQLSGPKVNARWYDPTNGNYATVTGSSFHVSGSQTFRPNGNNASGSSDWVLVLKSTQ